ncbi:MAG: transposase family protein [Proteobacteria bacterium]|nr:transposase family protein [Pseudomonadota bacterium]
MSKSALPEEPEGSHSVSKSALPEDEGAKAKAKYRVTNWPDYDRALVRRGDVTVSDAAIQMLLMLKAVFGLPYRSVEGLARSLMRLSGLAFPVLDHTQMSRRAGNGRGRFTCGGFHGAESLRRRQVESAPTRRRQAPHLA